MRVELVLPSLVRAGMEVITADLGIRLQARGHQVGFTCIHEGGVLADTLVAEGIRVSVVQVPGVMPNLVTRRMTDHLRGVSPDVVHSQSGAWLKVARAARRAGVPGIVHTIHGLHDRERTRDRALMLAGSMYTDVVTTVSEPLREYLLRRVRVPGRKVRTILNGVDHARFSPGGPGWGIRQKLGLPSEVLLIGIVARFSAVKDHKTLLAAFDALRPRHPHVHLVLIGDGELRSELEDEIHRAGMAQQVHMIGSLDDTAPAYRDLDVFVLSSLNEGTSISVLEALSSGLPVVATRVGGNPDLIEDGANGFLVPPRDPDRLAEALRKVLNDAALRSRMAGAARRQVEAELTLTGMVDRYEAVYRELCADRLSGASRGALRDAR